jgi:DNA polymerase-3 subunit epsilon
MDAKQVEDDLGIALDVAPSMVPKSAPALSATSDRYIVIDTEGSGLFDFKRPADDVGQPRLAELVMIFVDADLKVEREYQTYIRPEGWEMAPGATAVNKLTTEFLTENGVPVTRALDEFRAAILDGRVVVAHNVQHDLKHLRAEFRHAKQSDLFEHTRNVCTMRALTDVCRIPPNGNRGGFKFPKLSEACVFFGFELLGDHTALNDARACLQLFRKMRELNVVPEAKIHLAKVAPGKEAA